MHVEFAQGGLKKLELHALVARSLLEQPLVGVGRGAFTVAFLPRAGGGVRFAYAESLPLQWAFEWGVPVALVIAVTLTWVLARAFRSARSASARGACMGLCALTVQNLADYNLELTGVAVVAVACLAVVVGRGRGYRLRYRRTAVAMLGISGVMLLVTAPRVWGAGAHQQRTRLASLLERQQHDEFDSLLRRGLRAHPAEPNLVVLGATRAVRAQLPNSFRWLNRAMALAPLWGAPHALTAATLWNMRRYDQALIELREAGRLDPRAARDLLCTLVGQDAAALPRALPEGEHRLDLARSVQECMAADTPNVEAVDAWQRKTLPALDEPFVRSALRLQAAGDHAGARAILRDAVEQDPTRERLWSMLIVLRAKAGAPDAVSVCEQALERAGELAGVLYGCAWAHAVRGDAAAMRAALRRLRHLSRGRLRALERAARLQGALEARLGNRARAAVAYRKAYTYGGRVHDLLRVADIAESMGDLPGALAAYGQACREHPDEPAGCTGRHRLEGQSSTRRGMR